MNTSKKQSGKPDIYTRVTEIIIRRLKDGVAPWRRPWDNRIGCPRNLVSGAPYQGINIFLLGSADFASPFWMTFLQAKEAGGRVKKGAKAEVIAKVGKTKPKKDESESEDEKPTKRTKRFLRLYHVFNLTQIEGIEVPDPLASTPTVSADLSAARQVAERMPDPPEITYGETIRAFYSPVTDRISLPPLERFNSEEAYYLTLFHELIHATGHKKRLNRGCLNEQKEKGDTCYSFEELVAEMGAAYLGAEFGIVLDDHQASASYLDGWLNALESQDNRTWILAASTLARQAVEWICTEDERSTLTPTRYE